MDAHADLDIRAIVSLADMLCHLARGHPELSIGMPNLLDMPSLARRHSLHVAAVGILLAREMGLTLEDQHLLACAALTMNPSVHELQDQLSRQGNKPDAASGARLRMHAWHAAETLARLGVRDARWLMAVGQHHENLDGSGYPFGISDPAITLEARILRTADVWCAFLSHRHHRSGRPPRQALRELFRRERGKLDGSTLLALRHGMGYYPPGTVVRLANREVALVTRWFEHHARPDYVVSLLQATGSPMDEHRIRDTSRAEFAIREYAHLPQRIPALDWSGVWAAA
ncbi:MAG TPA: HD domain-containing phosphohydrolase [Thiobacillaceae bacterium]|nr:HD domain-containing phosphohydrolase [Thiobacillaceae bacterium]HNU64206.1 HD domain-containing phosphohydrolase [Thiobacillaceae bacterium]